jgi:hypothetical protein
MEMNKNMRKDNTNQANKYKGSITVDNKQISYVWLELAAYPPRNPTWFLVTRKI